jgi:AcrR family transcriptional regulator
VASSPVERGRRRDPNRKEAILAAAAGLIAKSGYAGVSMADIGAEVGIAASAIYWHFPGKQELLVQLFDLCLDRLLAEQVAAIHSLGEGVGALQETVRLQVEFVVEEREFARVYYAEMRNLPDADIRRLRRKQRTYVDNWARLLRSTRPELNEAAADALVHVTIGAVQASLVAHLALGKPELKALLTEAAFRVLGVGA